LNSDYSVTQLINHRLHRLTQNKYMTPVFETDFSST